MPKQSGETRDITVTVWAVMRFQMEGIHRYPGAKPSVEFLSCPHRHILHFEVKIQQFNNDRDIEYITTKRQLESDIWEKYAALPLGAHSFINFGSCEELALEIHRYLIQRFEGERGIEVSVFEDGENGCLIQ